MTRDKEALAMTPPLLQLAEPHVIRFERYRTQVPGATEDSPYSPYLRNWLAHQAAQHRSLLENIEAATRLGAGVIPARQ
jgi:hypothetical protein